jgi:hypothetical protein
MTDQDPTIDPLEQDLRAGLRWPAPDCDASVEDLAAWAEAPSEDAESVEAALVADPSLRRAVMTIRLHGPDESNDVDPALLRQLGDLMPAGPPVLARIGGWLTAAAAAVLLALGGWQLGMASSDTRSVDADTLAIATFGLDSNSSEQDFVVLLVDYQGPGK